MGSWLDRPKAILLDLDNTLYDWVGFFAPALRGMCRTLGEMTGIPSETLFSEFKEVFRQHGTVEYSFALQELPSLLALHPGESGVDFVTRYRPAIEVFQHRRRTFLHPYPGVISGLKLLRESGFQIYGVTDSRRFQAENRLKQLRLDRLMDGLCCVSDHAVPDADIVASIRRAPDDHYRSQIQNVFLFPVGVRKPSNQVLEFVGKSIGIDYRDCIYVGDSLAKDIAMAQDAAVYDCWAEYGARVSALDFATLVRVTDWPRAAVQEALHPSPDRLSIYPSCSAMSFDEIVALALTAPEDRPPRRTPIRPQRQLALFEVGPEMTGGAAG